MTTRFDPTVSGVHLRDGKGQRVAGAASILFVDDDASVCKTFQRTFSARGFSVITATSPQLAVSLARRCQPKLVVTDLRMPAMDGFRLIENLQETREDLLFAIVTGVPDIDLRRDCSPDTAILGVYAKPWNDHELADVLRRGLLLSDLRLRSDEERSVNRLKILVVEDTPTDARVLTRMLETECAADVCVVSHLRDAELLLGHRAFDVVFTDLHLPDAKGLDSVVHLRRIAEGATLLVTTGVHDKATERQVLRSGAQEFLIKWHFDPKSLLRHIEHGIERNALVGRLSRAARYDQLTDLPTVDTLREAFSQARRAARRDASKLAIMSLNLDRFRRINDTFGHAVGDTLLQKTAQRLTGLIGEQDTVARLGGDEFAVLLTHVDHPSAAERAAQRLLSSMQMPFLLNGTKIVMTLSIGFVVTNDYEAELDDLLRSADEAMCRAKQAGRNQSIQVGIKGPLGDVRHLALEEELRECARKRKLSLVYQPQFRVATGELFGFEALLRWQRADRTTVAPSLFVPLLEDLGLIAEVGAWVLDEACQELARWRAAGFSRATRMSVNLSGHQFERPGLVRHVIDALVKASLEPEVLELEITESVLMKDTRQTTEILTRLRGLGVRVAIDDFGTGYSSLSYLKRFDVNTLKIDRCFVQDMDHSRSACIASAIVGLGHRLGMEVIAEGVETAEHADLLRECRCDVAQGYFYGVPVFDCRTAQRTTGAVG